MKTQQIYYSIRVAFAALRHRRAANRFQYWDREQIQRYQLCRLQILYDYVSVRVPYYQELIRKLHIPRPEALADIRRFPILNRDELKQQFDRILSHEDKSRLTREVRTSGSTGQPLRIILNVRVESIFYALLWRAWNWSGYRLGDRTAILRGKIFENEQLTQYHPVLRALYVSALHYSDEHLVKIYEKLKNFQPKFIRGYPSTLTLLADWMQRYHQKPLDSVRAISTDSETLLDYQRRKIQQAFGVKVYDVYSHWEHIGLAAECKHGRKHIAEELGLLEILDQNLAPAKPGETGRLVGTTLHNFSMPLIRYDFGDLACFAEGPCPCGRQLRQVESIDGRIEDRLWDPDGRAIIRLQAALKQSPGIAACQMIQKKIDEIEVRVVKGKGFCERDILNLRHSLQRLAGPKMHLRISFVGEIPPGPNGKVRFVISKMKGSISEKNA
ncbi:MAG: phenylacetate--CoA ligase family protein [Calditrichaeota bacterium]|nr:MAG: phenylacetate--CoA ligase family protein [Calditrichota bacterium]